MDKGVELGRWVVTSAWPYVNTVPHLGNMIGSILSADVFARYLRLKGEDVVFVSGSDEHGTPIEIEAIKKRVAPKELTDQAHEYVSKLFKEWRISFDNYTRTESEVHKSFVRDFMLKLYENGYIFKQKEILPYCPKDKMFLPDRFVIGTCPYCGYERARGDQCEECGRLLHPTMLKNPRCAICGSKPELRETTHWFFDLPKLQDKVAKWLKESNLPENVKNYVLSWIEKEGLKPRSITRDNKWGIPAPFPGAEGKTIYVWFEALLGYISATIEYFAKKGEPEKWREYWLNKDTKVVYFIGKDNIPFHAVILPAMLIASGEGYVLPYFISATEYLLYEGSQFSKSRRWGVWIDEALEILPVDYWRFALIRMRPETKDINFTWKEFTRVINKELNDDIGNYVHRVLRFIESKFDSTIPEPGDYTDTDKEFIKVIEETPRKVDEEMQKFRIKHALEHVLELARAGNQYLNARAPWDAIKRDPRDAATTMYIAANSLVTLAITLAPFIPDGAERLWKMLNMPGSVHEKGIWSKAGKMILKPGHKIGKVEPLFKKLPQDFPDRINEILREVRKRVLEKRPPLLRE